MLIGLCSRSVAPKQLSLEECKVIEKQYGKQVASYAAKIQGPATKNYWNRPEKGVVIKTRTVHVL